MVDRNEQSGNRLLPIANRVHRHNRPTPATDHVRQIRIQEEKRVLGVLHDGRHWTIHYGRTVQGNIVDSNVRDNRFFTRCHFGQFKSEHFGMLFTEQVAERVRNIHGIQRTIRCTDESADWIHQGRQR